MHSSAYAFVETVLRARERAGLPPKDVVEFGSRNVNGTVRPLFLDAESYTGIDALPGPGVDIVMPAQDFTPDEPADYVICTSVLEHSPHAREIVENALRILALGGALIITTVSDPWPPHSAIDGGALREGEYYCNIDPEELQGWLPEGAAVATYPNGDICAAFISTEKPRDQT